MGLCGSKSGADAGTGGVMGMIPSGEKIKEMVFSMMVKKAMGGESDSQMGVLQSFMGKNFPNAKIDQVADPNAPPGTFNVEMAGKEIFNADKEGPLT